MKYDTELEWVKYFDDFLGKHVVLSFLLREWRLYHMLYCVRFYLVAIVAISFQISDWFSYSGSIGRHWVKKWFKKSFLLFHSICDSPKPFFFPMFPFDPPENIRKPKVFQCFQEDQKGTLGRKGLSLLSSSLRIRKTRLYMLNYLCHRNFL